MDKPFRTIVEVKPYSFGIDYSTPALLIGSCFTENIGQIMYDRKFPVMVNPFGVVYNPSSVALVLKRIAEGASYSESDLIQHNGLWLSLDHHTSFSRESKEECLKNINTSLAKANEFWDSAQFLIITFGTARIYRLNSTNSPVANCHKITAKEFTHSLLSVQDIYNQWSELLTKVFTNKPNLKVIFTVSPVRHWKDGAIGNQISKSTLLLAISNLVDSFSDKAFYFPSYEIMMDDLRDYRYYADDMLHPTPLATSYIWDKFKHASIFPSAQFVSNEVEKIIKAINHRPFNTNTKEYKQFVDKTIQQMEDIKQHNMRIDFSAEKNLLIRAKGY